MTGRLGKERAPEDAENNRPVHGWQKRGGRCTGITPDWELRVEDP